MNSHGLTPKEYKNFLYGKLLDDEQRSIGQKLSIILAIAEAHDVSSPIKHFLQSESIYLE